MTITFFSNFLNHHQLPLCKEFVKQVGDRNFHFVSCEPICNERARMGYEDMNMAYPFVVRAYESDEQMQMAVRLACESDVAIIGTAFGVFSEIRAKENKLTFLFCERIFKNGSWHRFIPTTAKQIYRSYIRYRNKNFYILCASAYAADDFVKCGFPREKCFSWGYFPEMRPKSNKSFDKLRLMWCGRMIWWKHPEDAVSVARMLKEKDVPFEMQIIGNGDKRQMVEKDIEKYALEDVIQLYDFMSPDDIRKAMEASNVYLFTSGKQEGWGVVLNEAMNSGCAVIANRKAGSSPLLIEDGKNGFLYDGTDRQLHDAVESLLASDIKSVGDAAFESIAQIWNPASAVSHFLKLVENINQGKSTL